MSECRCSCHGRGPYAPCDVDGGCGSLGCDYGADSEPSARRCVRGEHCQDREPVRDADGRHSGTWLPRRILVERGLCDTCTRAVGYALGHLAGDVVELTMMLGRANITFETLVSGSPDLPVPISLSMDALRAEIDDELQAWAEPVAEVLGVDWDTGAMGHSRQAVRVKRAADLLAHSVDVLLALPRQEHSAWERGEPKQDPDEPGVQATVIRDGVDGGLALLDLHRRAYFALGRTELVHHLPTPCPWCDMRALVRHNGADEVTCENCRRHIPERHYSWFCKVLVDLEQRRVSAA